jgi:hypothetical protein
VSKSICDEEFPWCTPKAKAGGGPQQPDQLPKHIKDLTFDPYRSLALIVRDQRGGARAAGIQGALLTLQL